MQISEGRAGPAGGGRVGSRIDLTMYWEVTVEEETKVRVQSGSSRAAQE